MITSVDELREAVELHVTYHGRGEDCIARADSFLMEECAELIQAVNHVRRGRASNDELIEEMTHVLIMIEMVMELRGISEEQFLSRLRDESLRVIRRLKRRIEHNGSHEELSEDEVGA